VILVSVSAGFINMMLVIHERMHTIYRTYTVEAADLGLFVRFYFVWSALTVVV
jgi:hypothetical protein